MEETYKAHLIRSGAGRVPDSNRWKPVVQVNWNEGSKERVKLWMEWHFKRSFRTEKAAEIEGHLSPKNGLMTGNQILNHNDISRG